MFTSKLKITRAQRFDPEYKLNRMKTDFQSLYSQVVNKDDLKYFTERYLTIAKENSKPFTEAPSSEQILTTYLDMQNKYTEIDPSNIFIDSFKTEILNPMLSTLDENPSLIKPENLENLTKKLDEIFSNFLKTFIMKKNKKFLIEGSLRDQLTSLFGLFSYDDSSLIEKTETLVMSSPEITNILQNLRTISSNRYLEEYSSRFYRKKGDISQDDKLLPDISKMIKLPNDNYILDYLFKNTFLSLSEKQTLMTRYLLPYDISPTSILNSDYNRDASTKLCEIWANPENNITTFEDLTSILSRGRGRLLKYDGKISSTSRDLLQYLDKFKKIKYNYDTLNKTLLQEYDIDLKNPKYSSLLDYFSRNTDINNPDFRDWESIFNEGGFLSSDKTIDEIFKSLDPQNYIQEKLTSLLQKYSYSEDYSIIDPTFYEKSLKSTLRKLFLTKKSLFLTDTPESDDIIMNKFLTTGYLTSMLLTKQDEVPPPLGYTNDYERFFLKTLSDNDISFILGIPVSDIIEMKSLRTTTIPPQEVLNKNIDSIFTKLREVYLRKSRLLPSPVIEDLTQKNTFIEDRLRSLFSSKSTPQLGDVEDGFAGIDDETFFKISQMYPSIHEPSDILQNSNISSDFIKYMQTKYKDTGIPKKDESFISKSDFKRFINNKYREYKSSYVHTIEPQSLPSTKQRSLDEITQFTDSSHSFPSGDISQTLDGVVSHL